MLTSLGEENLEGMDLEWEYLMKLYEGEYYDMDDDLENE